ncbi:winged helix-turn-helix domain-containing protein [Pseudonocardia oroxyli]|nr:winged helix-turn-helix domain-containing protein [Pseudonocardia oroxyli]
MPTGQYRRRWEAVADDLREKIKSGRWQAGDRLPPISQLRETYAVSPGTIKTAISALSDEGLVRGVAGSGIYVNG